MNERAVSEAIGFIIILGIVMSGIGLVTLYGYPVLVKEQSNTDVRNMERAMIVIQNDMKSLCFKNVPYKETTLQVSGGTLEVINATSYGGFINVTNGTTQFQENYTVGALTYRSNRGTEVITLENGAVMLRQEGSDGSAMLAEPRWFYDEATKTFVVYIMNITADAYMAKSGMTTVRMSLENSTTQSIPVWPGNKVTVEYKSGSSGDYSTAWENYLTGTSVGMERTAIDGKYERNDVDKLVIKEYRIKILDI
ncbi:DUF7289 family protein [Methanoculleus receptaculi]|uniref:Uncharacterized protein n=1 Tax=Methanoculleus receptaculi TaxID=394967 RepID=A0AAX4FY22_9EURY|nr:hypothetical protein [Methanoculleus receptaculi]WOX58637.1 hypothetical protein R6Y96_02405 [Methanoculleus receptaculi]